MVILAGFLILLQRVSGQEDIIIGTPISGRNRPELEQIIGLFLTRSFYAMISLEPDIQGFAFQGPYKCP